MSSHPTSLGLDLAECLAVDMLHEIFSGFMNKFCHHSVLVLLAAWRLGVISNHRSRHASSARQCHGMVHIRSPCETPRNGSPECCRSQGTKLVPPARPLSRPMAQIHIEACTWLVEQLGVRTQLGTEASALRETGAELLHIDGMCGDHMDELFLRRLCKRRCVRASVSLL